MFNWYKDKFVTAIITAAGSGRRMGADVNKVFLNLGQRPIIDRTIEKIYRSSYVDHIVLVIRKEDEKKIEDVLLSYDRKKFILVYGGPTREDSTYRGLMALPEETDLVVGHDGARPFITSKKIDQAIETLKDYDGLVFGVASKDTIKLVGQEGIVEKTLDRSCLYNIQTPQIFKKDILLFAYEEARKKGLKATDDSGLVEAYGGQIVLFEGDYSNIKITTIEDLAYGEILLKREL